MTAQDDRRLLSEMVHGHAHLEGLHEEGFTDLEISAARKAVERDEEDSFPSFGQDASGQPIATPSTSSAVTAGAG